MIPRAERRRIGQMADDALSPYSLRQLHWGSQDGRCAHCGIGFDTAHSAKRAHLDHKIPLLSSGYGSNKSDSHGNTIENTWLICAACHQAKTAIENSSHVVVRHRWRAIWLSRSNDGKWHLTDLQELAETTTCGRRGGRRHRGRKLRIPGCTECKLMIASTLVSHECVARSGRGTVVYSYSDALRFYQSINDRQSAGALILVVKGRRTTVYVNGTEERLLAGRYRL